MIRILNFFAHLLVSSLVHSWNLYYKVQGGNLAFFENKFSFEIAVDLNKCIVQIELPISFYTHAPTTELPLYHYTITMGTPLNATRGLYIYNIMYYKPV